MSSPAAHLAVGGFRGHPRSPGLDIASGPVGGLACICCRSPGSRLRGVSAGPRRTSRICALRILCFLLWRYPCCLWRQSRLAGRAGGFWRWQGLEVACAGASHLLLDLAVAVMKLPLFWPFLRELYHSPVGLLPSAALPGSSVFLRNLALEALVLVPLCALLGLAFRRRLGRRRTVSVICLVVMLMGMFSCACLERH